MSEAPEFSRPFAVDRLGAAGVTQAVAASPDECAALAQRLRIPAVAALSCRFRLRRGEAGRVHAEADLAAEVVQVCVVTLDEFAAPVAEKFHVSFVPAGSETLDDDPEAEDEIPYEGGMIDLGEAAAEQLALALEPYPRKPGATLPEAAGEAAASPFAVLARRARDS